MTTAAPSTALATIQPVFTDPERLAPASFLAGYRGLTREAYRVLRPRAGSPRPRPRHRDPALTILDRGSAGGTGLCAAAHVGMLAR
jgi:hypothetical protein